MSPANSAAAAAACLLTLVGCGVTGPTAADDDAVCERATEHVRACFPGEEVVTPEDCDPAAARRTLETSCEKLARDDKTDGLCNPWMWWTCDGGSHDGGDAGDTDSGNSDDWSDQREVWVRVKACTSDLCDRISGSPACARVVIEDRDGVQVASAHTGRLGGAHWPELGLSDGEYTAKVHRTGGGVAEMMTEREFEFGRPGRAPAEISFTVGGDDEIGLDFYVTQNEVGGLERCASLRGTVESTCEGAPMTAEETEWSWFARLSGSNADGEYVDHTRPFRRHERPNAALFDLVLPGEYTLTFLEMEIPEHRRENNPDYTRLVDRYATGRSVDSSVIVTADDATSEVGLGHVALEHESCR